MNNVISLSGGKDSTAMGEMMLERGEKWKDIPWYEGAYLVSDFGRVKSLGRHDAKMNRWVTERILKPGKNLGGYLFVGLSKNGIRNQVYIHRLVCEVFIGPAEVGYDAMHLENNKENNRLDNLRYGSRSCNMAFTIDDGTATIGEKNGSSKLTDLQVLEIRGRYIPRKVTFKKLAEEYGVCMQVISKVIYRETWRHI